MWSAKDHPLNPVPSHHHIAPPEEEHDRVKSAIRISERIASNENQYPDCHRTFAENCAHRYRNDLKDLVDTAAVWRDMQDGLGVRMEVSDPTFERNTPSYTVVAFRWGEVNHRGRAHPRDGTLL